MKIMWCWEYGPWLVMLSRSIERFTAFSETHAGEDIATNDHRACLICRGNLSSDLSKKYFVIFQWANKLEYYITQSEMDCRRQRL
jgi:hypothetical protein